MMAREGLGIVLIGLVLTVIFIYGANRLDSKSLFVLAIVFGIVTLFSTFFFRDPPRSATGEPGALIAPADGKIVGIESGLTHPHIKGPAVRISIFLSVFDVHVNRVPTSGVVDYVNYNPGKFLAAYEDKASEKNEQTEIGLTTPTGTRAVFKQIAGLIARRIVCHLKKGETVVAGQRFGIIRFGSRCDLLIPADSRLQISLGQYVKGGETIVGYLPTAAQETKTAASGDQTDAL